MKKSLCRCCCLAVVGGWLAACASPAAPTVIPAFTATVVVPTATVAPPPTATAVPAPTATVEVAADTAEPAVMVFKVTGLVTQEMGWSMAELKALPSTAANAQNNQGDTQSFTGVLIATLLAQAAPQATATTAVFLGAAGEKVEVPLADVLACANCILTFRSQGGLSLLLPFYAQQLALKGVLEVQVK